MEQVCPVSSRMTPTSDQWSVWLRSRTPIPSKQAHESVPTMLPAFACPWSQNSGLPFRLCPGSSTYGTVAHWQDALPSMGVASPFASSIVLPSAKGTRRHVRDRRETIAVTAVCEYYLRSSICQPSSLALPVLIVCSARGARTLNAVSDDQPSERAP